MKNIYGRVLKITKLGKMLAFITISSDGAIIRLVAQQQIELPKKGDYVSISYLMIAGEKKIKNIKVISHPRTIIALPQFIARNHDPLSLEALMLRSKVEEAMINFLIKKKFSIIHSPTIVGKWVKGRTGSFDIRFYSADASLSISNMLYHIMIMQSGYENIFEISKIFRQENPSDRYRLAEFTMLDIGVANKDKSHIMKTYENLILAAVEGVRRANPRYHKLPDNINFAHIEYNELLKKTGMSRIEGAQLPQKIRLYLNENYNSFVWIENFDKKTRPFFVKSYGNVCNDYQLWFRGVEYLAAGGERETNYQILCSNILDKGKDIAEYDFYLKSIDYGCPQSMFGIGMGVERFMGCVLSNGTAADYAWFPRYKKMLYP